jgi:hypothetical protein
VALLAAEGEPLGWASIVTPIGFLALLIGFPLCVRHRERAALAERRAALAREPDASGGAGVLGRLDHVRGSAPQRGGRPQFGGVADGTRTRDHRDHNPGLYQLSYRHRARIHRSRATWCE